jgi:hypothetical protein
VSIADVTGMEATTFLDRHPDMKVLHPVLLHPWAGHWQTGSASALSVSGGPAFPIRRQCSVTQAMLGTAYQHPATQTSTAAFSAICRQIAEKTGSRTLAEVFRIDEEKLSKGPRSCLFRNLPADCGKGRGGCLSGRMLVSRLESETPSRIGNAKYSHLIHITNVGRSQQTLDLPDKVAGPLGADTAVELPVCQCPWMEEHRVEHLHVRVPSEERCRPHSRHISY